MRVPEMSAHIASGSVTRASLGSHREGRSSRPWEAALAAARISAIPSDGAGTFVTIGVMDTPIGPVSAADAIPIVASINVRAADFAVPCTATPRVITCASAVGAERSGGDAQWEHAGGSPVVSAG
jgi:hypothetical protein